MADEEKNVEQAEAQQPVDQTIDAPQAEEAAAQQPEASTEAAKPSELDQAKADLAPRSMTIICGWPRSMTTSASAARRRRTISTPRSSAETVEKFLPVYDNLERALAQQTADEAYQKGRGDDHDAADRASSRSSGVDGVRRSRRGLRPQLHNAVMHVEDESAGRKRHCGGFPEGLPDRRKGRSASQWSKSQTETASHPERVLINL